MQTAKCSVTVVLVLMVSGGAVRAQTATGEPMKLRTLLDAPAAATPLTVGESHHDLNVGTQPVLVLRPAAVGPCATAMPDGCPEVPVITGFADLSAPWSAQRMDGRVLVVRNVGPGVVVVRGEDDRSSDVWRLASSRVLVVEDVLLLVYDGAKSRWQLLSGAAKPVTGSGNPQ